MKITKPTFSLALLLMTLSFSVHSAGNHLSDELKASIKKRIALGLHPGVVIGIVDDTGSYFYGFGRVDLETDRVPDKDTIYEIGSIGKTFTATLLADKVASGELDPTLPAQELLPDGISMPDFNGKQITLEHLATHRSSLPRMPSNFKPRDPANPFADYKISDLYDFLNSCELDHAPGTKRLYSNVGFGLLGHLLSLQGDKSYEALVDARITMPLMMTSTAITLNADQKQRFAPPYHLQEDRLVSTDHWDVPALAGAGALRSSTVDMMRYLSANLGLIEHNPLAEAMAAAQRPRDSDGVLMGLSWSISGSEPRLIYAHNGGTGGYRTFAGFIPAEKFGVIVMTNSNVSVDDIGVYLLVGSYPLNH